MTERQSAPSAPDFLESLLELILARPVSVVIGALGALILGLVSLWRLPVSLLPTLERPRLEITARDRERSRDELEAQVARPLERRLTTLGGVIDVTSTIDDGEVRLVLETEWQTDIDRLRIEVERRLVGEATTNLEALSVDVDSGDGQPILRIAVQGASATRSTAFADQVLLPELSRLEGAGRIGLVGAADLRPVVAPRAADLFAHGLVPGDLVQGLAAVGRDRPLGRLSHGGTLRPVLVRQPVRDLEALERLEVTPAGLRLADVADITLGEVPRGGLARVDGAAAVVVEVFRAPGANAVRLAREAREVVSELAPRAGALKIFVFDDGSREVTASLLQLAQAGLIGLALGTLILRLLLGSFRQAVAMVVVVPVSILAAFSAFLVADVSLDLISLAGLALAAGMLVDNSIVVLESIASARERRSGRPVLAGSRQIAMALVASFLTTAVVFVPLIYLRGLARAFFGVQAFAIVSTLALSLALSLTLTPVLARWDRRGGSAPGRGGRQPGRSLYLKALERGLENPWPGLAATLALLAGVFALVPQLPRELVPSGVSRVLVAEIALPPGLESAEAEKRLLSLERALAAALSRGAVEPAGWSILQRSAAPKLRRSALGVAESLGSPTEAQMTLHFESPELLERALPEVRRAAQAVPGLRVRLARRQGAVSSAVVRAASQLEIELTASTTRRLASLRRSAVALLTEDGWSPREGSWDERAGRPAWWLRFEPARLAELELSPGLLVTQLRAGLEPLRLGRTAIEGVDPDIHFAASAGPPERFAVRIVQGAAGSPSEERIVPLGALAEVSARPRASPRERRGGRPATRLAIAGATGDAERLESTLKSLPLAEDSTVQLAGQTRELRRSFSQLQLSFALALLLIFLTVAALYESLTLPLVVMTTVPVASAGAFLGLLAAGESLNVMSLLGLILLAGIVVNNAIVLLHRAEQRRRGGESAREAIRQAAAERYRPILMTTLTTLLGMIPLALLGGEGLELRRALAVSVAGGLVSSWLAALLVVPRLYVVATALRAGDPPRLRDRRRAAA